MGGLSLPHLLIVALIVLVLFGRGRISEMMGDFGKGIKSFKSGMSEETDRPAVAPPVQIAPPPPVAPQQQAAPPQQATLNGETPVVPGADPATPPRP